MFSSPAIRVIVAGASGRMGLPIVATVLAQPDMVLVGAVSPTEAGNPVPNAEGVIYAESLQALLDSGVSADVVVDVTHPEIGLAHTQLAVSHGLNVVVGTSGMDTKAQEAILNALSSEKAVNANTSVLIAPNFAVGAVLLMRFAREASKYFQHSEIVEYHHNQKLDAPSGTALQTAAGMRHPQGNNPSLVTETELLPGARGGTSDTNVNIHSVRLPGLVAHQEVLFGSEGQLLTLRHDSFNRDCFMPGVMLAIRHVVDTDGGLQVGLEHAMGVCD